mgnify:CR=1 FL=1
MNQTKRQPSTATTCTTVSGNRGEARDPQSEAAAGEVAPDEETVDAPAPTRLAAIDAQAAALDQFLIEGIAENIPFLGAVMEEKEFRSGDFTTAYIKKHFPEGFQGAAPTKAQEALLIACAGVVRSFTARRAMQNSGRLNGPANGARQEWVVMSNGVHHPVNVVLDEKGADVTINGKKHRFDSVARPGSKA